MSAPAELPRGYHHGDPRDTELAAAESAYARAATERGRMVALFRAAEPGDLTDWELADAYKARYGGPVNKTGAGRARWQMMAEGLVIEARTADGDLIKRPGHFRALNQAWRMIRGYEQVIPLPRGKSQRHCPHRDLAPAAVEAGTGDWVRVCLTCDNVWLRAPRTPR